MGEVDSIMMMRALRLATRGEGRVEPNPMVGCVIALDKRVIGEGYHRRFGGPHAEVEALRACTRRPHGATVYITLEPCTHFGKTPPCVDALIAAGVSRVVAAKLDPNPAIHGRGVKVLRRAGINVEVGLLGEQASRLIRPFRTRMLLGRPYVIAKWAQSINGVLVPGPGDPRWISCERSRSEVHRLRARMDAILTGIGTVLVDDPLLTARGVPLRRLATRMVLDSKLRIRLNSSIVRTSRQVPVVVFATTASSRSAKADRLRRAGVEVIGVAKTQDGVSLAAVLGSAELAGATNVLVEGGPTVLNQFFAAGLVDEAQVFVAPRVLSTSPKRAQPIELGRRTVLDIEQRTVDCDRFYRIIFE